MALSLVFLGRLEDVAGGSSRSVEYAPSLDAVMDGLQPELAEALRGPRIRCAVNGALVHGSDMPQLFDGDEIAFLPPVSGG